MEKETTNTIKKTKQPEDIIVNELVNEVEKILNETNRFNN